MPEHTVSSFDAELKELGRKVVEMGGQAERLVADSVTALIRRDAALAQRVILLDATIVQVGAKNFIRPPKLPED